jgi:hypothetical protein
MIIYLNDGDENAWPRTKNYSNKAMYKWDQINKILLSFFVSKIILEPSVINGWFDRALAYSWDESAYINIQIYLW